MRARCLRLLLALLISAVTLAPVAAQNNADQEKVLAGWRRAEALAKEGQRAEAIAEYEGALTLSQQAYGAAHVETAKIMNNLAILYQAVGQFAKAEPLFRSSLEIREAKLGKDHLDVAQSLRNLALLYRAMGRNAAAQPLLVRSLEIREAKLGKDHLDVAASLHSLAACRFDAAQYREAEPLYQRSLQIREKKLGPDHIDVARSLHSLAILHSRMSAYAKAEALYLRSLQISEVKLGKEDPEVARILNNLGILYAKMRHYAKAEPLHQRSRQILEAKFGKGHPSVAGTLANLASLHATLGQYQQAESLAEQSLRIHEAKLGKDHLEVADGLSTLGWVYSTMGEYATAEPLYQRSLEVRQKKLGHDHPTVAGSLQELGSLYRDMGQYAKAELLYQRCLKIREEKLGKEHPFLADTLNSLAELYRVMGQYAKAEPLYQRSLQIREECFGRENLDVAVSLNNLALLYQATDQLPKAESYCQRSLKIIKAELGDDHPRVALSLNNLGFICQSMGQLGKAEPLYLRSIELYEAKLGKEHPEVARPVGNLAEVYTALGQYDKAELLCRRCLEISEARLGKDHPSVSGRLQLLARIYGAQQSWSEAVATTEHARRIARRHVSRVLPGLGDSEQLSYLQNIHAKSLHQALSVGLSRPEDGTLAAASAAWHLNGKSLTQEVLAERALLARDAQDPQLAEVAQNLIKVRQRLAALAIGEAPAGPGTGRLQQLQELTEQEQALVKRLAQARGGVAQDDPWVELEQVRRALPTRTVLVELMRFRVFDFQSKGTETAWRPPHYAAWIIPPPRQGSVRLIDLGPADKIEAAVKDVRLGLREAGDPDRSRNLLRKVGEAAAEQALRQRLEALSKLCLEPLLSHIGQAERWIISPDADLWLIPWAALPLGSGPDAPYALEKHKLSYVVSGRDLVRSVPKVGRDQPMVLADPDYDMRLGEGRSEARASATPGRLPERAERLEGTAAEAKDIKAPLAKYAGQEPRVYLGNQALESEVKAARSPRVLVLSTHGYFLEDQETTLDKRDSTAEAEKALALTKEGQPLENPLLRCGLIFAGFNHRQQAREGEEDSVLTGLEIVGLNLRGTEMVVLSACDTGVGQVRNGEGVAGLRQAFQLAGAHSVVGSLWPVPDQQTARLMGEFFKQLAEGENKADALHEAQLAYLKYRRQTFGAAHPFYWAAFTLTGKWE